MILVAERFGLEILDSNIQNEKDNQTRFVLIGKEAIAPAENANKATLKFELSHSLGSLSNTLQMFTTFNINLTKIQSLPIIDNPWNYAFFADVVFDDYQEFQIHKDRILGKVFFNDPKKQKEILKYLEK